MCSLAVVRVVGVCFRGFGFVGWGARRRCCGMVRGLLLRSVGLEGGGRGGGGLGCSVVGVGEASFCFVFWVGVVVCDGVSRLVDGVLWWVGMEMK